MKIIKRGRSISWKTAFLVVVGLHVLGYAGISQYSSYRAKLAKELKDARNSLYSDNKLPIEWPKQNKPKVVHHAKPLVQNKITTAPKTPPSQKITIPNPLDFIPTKQIKNEISKVLDKKEKIKPSTVYVSQTTYKPTKTIQPQEPEPEVIKTHRFQPDTSQPFDSPDHIPVRRAVPVNRSTQDMYEKITESREIISSHIVLR